MRFVTLVCSLAVAICVYSNPANARQANIRGRPAGTKGEARNSASSVPLKRELKTLGEGRGRLARGRSNSAGRAGSQSSFTCDFRTSASCFRCANQNYNGEGVPDQYVNDGFADCADNSDEQSRSCILTATNTHECFACTNPSRTGEAVFRNTTCDGINDCDDGSDEVCERECNADDHESCFRCFSPNMPGEGVYPDLVCDNRADCIDGSDELCFECDSRGYRYCDEGDDCNFDISIDHVCNGVSNCWNNEDESSCFYCADGSRIDSDWVCDDYTDCADNSDELPPICGESSAAINAGQCSWKEWGAWSSTCSCESETQVRMRPCHCTGEASGGCEGNGDEQRSCSAQNCQEGGCTWLAWGEWSPCSDLCGAGKSSRERACSCGTGQCGDDSREEQGCHGNSDCPVEAEEGCGTRLSARMRIVGGEDAQQTDWPWQAQLFYRGNFLCGGTLYNNRYVISAAHCFVPGRESPSDWEVHLGKQETFGEPRHTSDVTAILFDEYNSNTFDNDIVIMELSTPIAQSDDYVNNICLDVQRTKTFAAGSNCYITGFGLTEDGGQVASTLQEASVPYINRHDCRNTGYSYGDISTKMFCAGYPNIGGIDACQGDSGGPLVCTAPDDDDPSLTRWYLVGVTSWGIGCARADLPGVYTDVSQFIDWLEPLTQ